MNKEQRKQLADYQSQIEDIKIYLEDMRDDEQQKLDDLEDRGIYEGSNHDNFEGAVDALEEIIDNLDTAIDSFNNIDGF